jgi:hypothetical protein
MEPFDDNEDEEFVLDDEVVDVDEERTTSRYMYVKQHVRCKGNEIQEKT